MMLPSHLILAGLLLSLSGGVWAIDGTPNVESSVAAVDRDFASAVVVAGRTEIDAAKLALQRSKDKDVRRFARHMLVEHGRLQAGLAQASQVVGMTLPEAKADEQTMKALQEATAATFDHRYIDTMAVKAHMTALDLFTRQAERGQTLALRDWAAASLPTIKLHFEQGRKLAVSKNVAQ